MFKKIKKQLKQDNDYKKTYQPFLKRAPTTHDPTSSSTIFSFSYFYISKNLINEQQRH